MNKIIKSGGVASLYAGFAYIAGIMGFLFIVGWPDDPVQQIDVLVNNHMVLHFLYLIVYQIWAVFLIILTVSLYDFLRDHASLKMKIASAIGIIWATAVITSGMIFNIGMERVISLYAIDQTQATTVWLVIESVCNGLGGGNEILGGLWMLLISWAALQAGKLPRLLNYLGIVIGMAGILSALPGLGDIGLIFGLFQIVWFIWLGIFLLNIGRRKSA